MPSDRASTVRRGRRRNPAISAVAPARNVGRHAKRSLRIVITAGPTREYLDSVRFLSNPSSGKMGYAIAEAAVGAGHDVTLISGPVSLKPPRGVRVVDVSSAAEMASAARAAFARADAAVFAAAVCDYRPLRRARRKLPKCSDRFALTLTPTIDIAASLGRVKGRRVTIAFALEDHDGRRHAEAKMLRKNCDAIVLNSPRAVASDMIRVEFLERGGRSGRAKGTSARDLGPDRASWQEWGEQPKEGVARRLVHVLERLTSAEAR